MKLYKVFLNLSLEADEKSLSYVGLFAVMILMVVSPSVKEIWADSQYSNMIFFLWLVFNLVLQVYFLIVAYQMGVRLRWGKANATSVIAPLALAVIVVAELSLILNCIDRIN